VIPVIHLTSDKSNNFVEKRAKQLKNLFAQTSAASHCIIVGDFNFGDGEEHNSFDWGEFKDTWLQLHPKKSGYTFDPNENSVAQLTSRSGTPRRLDR
jgi:hypothetical protein